MQNSITLEELKYTDPHRYDEFMAEAADMEHDEENN
jgi:hypothetical protein